MEYVAKAAQAQASIKLNQAVVKIDTSKDKITISTASGESHTFDEVVVTCPLGWLKQNLSAFTPTLPPRLTSAIESISYGRLEKIFVRFPCAFWQKSQSPKQPNEPEKPFFAQFLEPEYVDHPEGIEWNQECMSLASLPENCAQPTLLFYTYGPSGAHIVSQIADLDPESEEYRDTLIGFTKPFYSRLQGYSETSPHCVPSSILATKWQIDPYAGYGSYSNFQIGLEQGDKDIEIMREGAGMERGVWFAGEHTSPFVALGTTTGAYWSGERAAKQICDKRGLSVDGVTAGMDDSLPSAEK